MVLVVIYCEVVVVLLCSGFLVVGGFDVVFCYVVLGEYLVQVLGVFGFGGDLVEGVICGWLLCGQCLFQFGVGSGVGVVVFQLGEMEFGC